MHSTTLADSSVDSMATLSRVWLFAGIAILALFPALLVHDTAFGWLPYWLVVAPGLNLAVLRRGYLGSQFTRVVPALASSWLRAPRRQAIRRPRAQRTHDQLVAHARPLYVPARRMRDGVRHA